MSKNTTDKTAVLMDRYGGNASTKDQSPALFNGKLGLQKKNEFLLNLKNQQCFLEMLTAETNTVIFFYKHNNYKDTYGKKCEKINIILSIMLR